MEIKIPQYIFDPKDPFKGDPLERIGSADVLTSLVSSIEHPFVLAIEAEWGRGKTTFIKMWQAHLELQGFPSVLYNAWENDFAPDPFVSLFGEFQAFLDGKQKNKKAAAAFKKAKSIGLEIAKQAIPVAAKFATLGALNTEKLVEAAIGDVMSKLVAQGFEEYTKQKGALQALREAMSEFAAELRAENPEELRPLIFFIDELDRCRPTYAVELLERMKHCFYVPGIVFVLAIDTEQLQHAVKTLYGAEMRADGYLRRFIDLTYRLPDPPKDSFANFLMGKYQLEGVFQKRKVQDQAMGNLLEAFGLLFPAFSLGLREQEHCFSWLNLVMRTVGPSQPIFPIGLAFLFCWKANDPRAYHDFCAGQLSWKLPGEILTKTPSGREFWASNFGAAIEAYSELGFADHEQFRKITADWREKQSRDAPRWEAKVFFSQQLVRADLDHGQFWDYLHGLIEMTEQFRT